MASHQPYDAADQDGGAERDIQAPRHRAEQCVTGEARHCGYPENVETQAGPGTDRVHTAAWVDRPPNRRSRARKSFTAAARSVAVKSGHIVSVNHSSAYADSHKRKSDSRCSPPVRIRRSTSGSSAPLRI